MPPPAAVAKVSSGSGTPIKGRSIPAGVAGSAAVKSMLSGLPATLPKGTITGIKPSAVSKSTPSPHIMVKPLQPIPAPSRSTGGAGGAKGASGGSKTTGSKP
eukprot:scaffold109_cov389-Prasinococcus_capsulatus_cf.AAC.4